ncbi:hypothetical protein ACQPU1_17430 [Clostridium paraputrificum]|uniref:hypothetical protein n=1 Tax=Clostridium paraputrificum TaxID=29363 RepID=UPI003D34CE74
MKKIAVPLITLALLFSGCSQQNQLTNEDTTSNIAVNEPFTKSSNIEERYNLVDKENLKYEINKSDYYFYETETSFVHSAALSQIPNIDDKTYGEILTSYTYASEINPTNIPYEKAISLAKSLLPNDIKEERIKHDSYTDKYFIIYSSSVGTFVLGLVPEYQPNSTNLPLPSRNIVGIDYMKEIIN